MSLKSEMHEAEPRVARVMEQIATTILKEGGEDKVRGMSLAMSVLVQVFLRQGGNVEAGEEIGEMVKQGVITIMGACRDISKATHFGNGRVN